MLFRWIVFNSLWLYISSSHGSTEVDSCDTGIFPNVTVHIKSQTCSSTPCVCIPGCPFSISFQFNSPRYLENIKPQIIATYAGVSLNYPLFQEDACQGIKNTQCPIVQDEPVEYTYTMNVLNIFPEVTVSLRFSLIDKDVDEDFVCFKMDIDVKKIQCPVN